MSDHPNGIPVGENSIALAPLAGVVVLLIASALIITQFAGESPRARAKPTVAHISAARPVTASPPQGAVDPAVTSAAPTRAVSAQAMASPTAMEQATDMTAPAALAPTATPGAPASPTPGEVAISEPITVSVTNRACLIQNYGIDNAVTLTVAPGETKSVASRTGEHSVQICFPGTGDCGERTTVLWAEPVSVTIDACPASITVQVTNKDCDPQRYYVDGQLVAPYLVQDADTTFDTNPGYHRVHTCNIETGDCSEDVLVIWADSTETLIAPSGRCDNK